MCSQRLYHTTSSKLLLVQCCSEKESCLLLWLLRNNSLLCRQLPVLPWVKSPGLSSPSNGMGSSDKLDALIRITPCCCVSHETFWVPQYSPWTPWCLFGICNAFQNLVSSLPHALAQTPSGHSHSLEVTVAGDSWSFLLKK